MGLARKVCTPDLTLPSAEMSLSAPALQSDGTELSHATEFPDSSLTLVFAKPIVISKDNNRFL